MTLDALIARYGVPAFIKIDVEGFEDAALHGLSQPVQALSFEFTTIARDVTMGCLRAGLSWLGSYRYNFAPGESQILTFERWLSVEEVADFLSNLPHAANSGEVSTPSFKGAARVSTGFIGVWKCRIAFD